MLTLALVITVVSLVILGVVTLRMREKIQGLVKKLEPILNAEQEAARIVQQAKEEHKSLTKENVEISGEIDVLKKRYNSGYERFQSLQSELKRLEENLESIENGLYKPHFTFEDSESYKKAIEDIRKRQEAIVKRGDATSCSTKWEVGGSSKAGERMVKQTEKLLLRAFNAESDAAISNVSWNNFDTMRARIEKAREVLNKHGTVLQVSLSKEYVEARLRELELVYEAVEKKKQERDAQREQRAAQKEEERVQRELAKAQDDAEKDEKKYEKALEKARAEVVNAQNEEREALEAKIAKLESELADAHTRKERAIAQAQLTRVGHVYVISNIGAFGEGVVKIGMTRRLEPEERVKELGDASVPFPFDLHALIYSEDAPSLESELHKRLWDRRVNLSNERKEFFKASLSDVQDAIRALGIEKELLLVPEAREYRETVALLQQWSSSSAIATKTDNLPQNPFD